jgi:hypothetical protein
MEPESIYTNHESQSYNRSDKTKLTSSSASTKTPNKLLDFANSTAAPITDSLEFFASSLERAGTGKFVLFFPHRDTKNTGSGIPQHKNLIWEELTVRLFPV